MIKTITSWSTMNEILAASCKAKAQELDPLDLSKPTVIPDTELLKVERTWSSESIAKEWIAFSIASGAVSSVIA